MNIELKNKMLATFSLRHHPISLLFQPYFLMELSVFISLPPIYLQTSSAWLLPSLSLLMVSAMTSKTLVLLNPWTLFGPSSFSLQQLLLLTTHLYIYPFNKFWGGGGQASEIQYIVPILSQNSKNVLNDYDHLLFLLPLYFSVPFALWFPNFCLRLSFFTFLFFFFWLKTLLLLRAVLGGKFSF